MGFYDDHHLRHGHRTPAELAEDEILEALYGNVCAPGHVERSAASARPTDATRRIIAPNVKEKVTTQSVGAAPAQEQGPAKR